MSTGSTSVSLLSEEEAESGLDSEEDVGGETPNVDTAASSPPSPSAVEAKTPPPPTKPPPDPETLVTAIQVSSEPGTQVSRDAD